MSFVKLIIRALLTLHKDGTDFYIIGEKKESETYKTGGAWVICRPELCL